MKFNTFIDVMGGVVIVALATTLVSSRNTAGVVTASGTAFSNILASALGKGSVH
jgi:hypothetical protein